MPAGIFCYFVKLLPQSYIIPQGSLLVKFFSESISNKSGLFFI